MCLRGNWPELAPMAIMLLQEIQEVLPYHLYFTLDHFSLSALACIHACICTIPAFISLTVVASWLLTCNCSWIMHWETLQTIRVWYENSTDTKHHSEGSCTYLISVNSMSISWANILLILAVTALLRIYNHITFVASLAVYVRNYCVYSVADQWLDTLCMHGASYTLPAWVVIKGGGETTCWILSAWRGSHPLKWDTWLYTQSTKVHACCPGIPAHGLA